MNLAQWTRQPAGKHIGARRSFKTVRVLIDHAINDLGMGWDDLFAPTDPDNPDPNESFFAYNDTWSGGINELVQVMQGLFSAATNCVDRPDNLWVEFIEVDSDDSDGGHVKVSLPNRFETGVPYLCDFYEESRKLIQWSHSTIATWLETLDDVLGTADRLWDSWCRATGLNAGSSGVEWQHPRTVKIEDSGAHVVLDALELLRARTAIAAPWVGYEGGLGDPEFYRACVDHAVSVMENALVRSSPVVGLPDEAEAEARLNSV